MSSADFFAVERRHVWVVKRLLVWGEPVVIGGPRKCLKTSLLLDLAISLASGTNFLGHFDVYRTMKVAILSGESGATTIEQAARRICFARGIDPRTLNIDWQFKLPKLPSDEDLAKLKAGLKRAGIQVVIIDPLYLCLLSGSANLDASNLFDTGPVLMRTAVACAEAGAMPILAHHSRKDLKPGEPMELEHLAFSGIQEFARQWLLVNRRERFDAETGRSSLFVSGGGSAGQSGEWYVDITEGKLRDDFSGRTWDVSVTGLADGVEAAVDKKAQAKAQKVREKERDEEVRILDALELIKKDNEVPTKKQIRHYAGGMNNDKAAVVLIRLIQSGDIEKYSAKKWSGTGNKVLKIEEGYRNVTAGTAGSKGHSDP